MAAVANAVHALKWSWAGEVASKAIAPLTFVALAAILKPEDMGVFAAATMVMTFAQVIWDGGMGKALIQRQQDLSDAANAAFWINMGLAAFVALLLLFFGGLIGDYIFKDARVADVLRIMTLQIIFAAAGACNLALMQRNLDFKRLFWIRFVTVALPGLAALPIALAGAGYWSMVVGAVVGQICQFLLLMHANDFRPRLLINSAVAKEMARFGGWVMLTGFLAWFYIWADSLVVGMYLGSHDLGIFRTGNQIAIMVYSLCFTPVLPILYSKLSRMAHDRSALVETMRRVVLILTTIAIPLAFIAAAISLPVSAVLFAQEWNGLGVAVSTMLLAHGYGWVAGMNGEAYRAMGKPQVETAIMAFAIPLYLIIFFTSIRYGLEFFLGMRLGLAIAAAFVHLLVLSRVLGISAAPFVRRIAFVSVISVCAGGLIYWFLGSAELLARPASSFLTLLIILYVSAVSSIVYIVYGRSLVKTFASFR